MPQPQFSIPRPCAQPWAAMVPTAAGRHCAACATEVVDFARLSDAELLALLARHRGQPVCARAAQLAPPAPVPRWRQWALAALAVLGLAPATVAGSGDALPPPVPPLSDFGKRPPAPEARVVVRGQVLDDRDDTPVAGARVLVDGTQYGTLANEQGRYELLMAASFEPLRDGTLVLVFSGSPFDFTPQTQRLKIERQPKQKPIVLDVRLPSIKHRGQVMGKIRLPEPPVAPPR